MEHGTHPHFGSAMKPMTSAHPAKPTTVATLKALSGGSKVTNVRFEDLGHGQLKVQGDCMAKPQGGRGGKFLPLGTFTATISQPGV
jgi:hypothetical protein